MSKISCLKYTEEKKESRGINKFTITFRQQEKSKYPCLEVQEELENTKRVEKLFRNKNGRFPNIEKNATLQKQEGWRSPVKLNTI